MERECRYCEEFHAPRRCERCGAFVRCAPDDGQADRIEQIEGTVGGMQLRVTYLVLRYTCRRCGDIEQVYQTDYIEEIG